MAIPITAKIRLARENSKNIPVIQKDLGSDIEGEANKDGTIFIDNSVDPESSKGKEIIEHEKVHMDQMERGDLAYDDKNVYWKGEAYPRDEMEEGAKNLPWEKEAWQANKRFKQQNA